MEPSSQQQPPQPSQEELAHGLPEGYPPTREHLHDVDPLPSGLQDRLDSIMRGDSLAGRPVTPHVRRLRLPGQAAAAVVPPGDDNSSK